MKKLIKKIVAPVKRFSGYQIITARYGEPRKNGTHKGVDLRTRRFMPGIGFVKQWALQNIVAPEKMLIKRFGTDGKGNDYIVCQPLEHLEYFELKFIHITVKDNWKYEWVIIEKGEVLGKSQLKGSSRAHHLHFEVLIDERSWTNPILYLTTIGSRYKFKNKMKKG